MLRKLNSFSYFPTVSVLINNCFLCTGQLDMKFPMGGSCQGREGSLQLMLAWVLEPQVRTYVHSEIRLGFVLCTILNLIAISQGCQTHYHQRPHQPRGCLQRAECNFNSLTVKEYIYTVLKLFRPFQGNCEANVAPGENEFDTPALSNLSFLKHFFFLIENIL